MGELITLRFNYGGYFKFKNNGEMVYVGGSKFTKRFDPNEVWYYDLMEIADSLGGKFESLFYLIPGQTMSGGLRKISNDNDAYEVGGLGVDHRSVQIFVYHGEESAEPSQTEPAPEPDLQIITQASQTSKPVSKPTTTIPKKGPLKASLPPLRSSPRKKQSLAPLSISKDISISKDAVTAKKHVPELVTVVLKQPTPVFQRLFMCFEGLMKGWKEGCRKILAVDGCFIKTFLGGQLLCAVGRDANDQMYPLAWAVAEGENVLSWEWFFNHLKSCLELGEGEDLSIISDEHQAILSAVGSVLPRAEHRHCARHIYANWHKTYRGDELKMQFWKIAKAYNEADYEDAFAGLVGINSEAAEAFKKYNPNLFCRAFLRTNVKSDAITSNIAETFNGVIINARTKHLLYMLEEIRSLLMQRMVTKRQEMEKSVGVLCPRIQAKLEKEKEKAANCEVVPSTDSLFNVSYYLDQVVVDLEAMSCTCRKWEMIGIPCCHAVACIFFSGKDAEDFVSNCYRRETYLKSYAGSIPPLVGERYWPNVQFHMDPPPIKIGPGRPRKNRIKDPYENPKKPGTLSRTGVEMTCTICKVKGHNKRGCPDKEKAVPTEPQPKRPRGRPRNDGQPPHSVTPAPPKAQAPQGPPTHHNVTAQPALLGRSGRSIRRGRGARGGQQAHGGRPAASAPQTGTGTSMGQGRGGRGGRGSRGGRGRGSGRGKSQLPRGVGVLFGEDGSVLNQAGGGRGRRSRSVNQLGGSSQQSTLHQGTQQ